MKRTKMLCAITSVLMAVLLIVLSVSAPIGALDTLTTSNESKIDSTLQEKMAMASPDEKIPVAIWYSDVDQDNIDKLTAQKVGFTRDDVAVAYEMPSTELLASLEKEEAGAADEMQAYLKRTEGQRKLERERTDEYIMTRRELSREKYNEKSAKLIKDTDIKAEDITFQSQYAPMVIVNITLSQIDALKKQASIKSLSYYNKQTSENNSIESAIDAMSVDVLHEYNNMGIYGENVKVGIVEDNAVRLSQYEEDGYFIVPESTSATTRTTSNDVELYDYGNVVVVGDTPLSSEITHADRVANTLLSVAPGITLYCSKNTYKYIEAMISDGINMISYSKGGPVLEAEYNYLYSTEEKWFDHIISAHGITVVCAAGNNGYTTKDYRYTYEENGETKSKWSYGPRVTIPGMAYNVITVGAYCDVPDTFFYTDYESGTNELKSVYHDSDTLCVYSSYKNSKTKADGTTAYGCEKPDVVAPSTFNKRGTSNSTPFVAGMIALILEIKPQLALYPQAIKAIVLASCHDKVNQINGFGTTETIQEGITDRQGAGVPNAWTMAYIVSSGTYGVGRISATKNQAIRRFVMPAYDATSMNVSLSWIRENVVDEGFSHESTSNITPGDYVNLDLRVYRNDGLYWSSTLSNSSTEMVYFDLNDSYNEFEIRINDVSEYEGIIRYGYAYSTDKSPEQLATDEGIYYIRNYLTDKYLTLDSATDETTLQYFASTSAGRQPQMWVLKGTQGDYEILPAYGNVGEKLNFGAQVGTNPYYKAVLGTNDLNLSLKSWETDTTLEPDAYVFTSTSGGSNNILSYTSSTGVFVRSATDPVVNMYRMWVLEDINFRRGDADLDGAITIKDATAIQKYIGDLEEFNNMQWYLADYNGDGVVNVKDSTEIQQYVAGI